MKAVPGRCIFRATYNRLIISDELTIGLVASYDNNRIKIAEDHMKFSFYLKMLQNNIQYAIEFEDEQTVKII